MICSSSLHNPHLIYTQALKNNLFIHEDGSVIEIHNDATEGKKSSGKSPQKKTTKKIKTKLVACGECEGCLKKACKNCDACSRKKRCSKRACSNIKRVPITDDVKTNGQKSNGSDDEAEDQSRQKTPRIRIRVGKSASSNKRKATEDVYDEEPESELSQDASSRKKARVSNGKRSSRSPATSDQSDTGEDEYDEMFDIPKLQTECEAVTKASFEDARNNMTKHGPWHLPSSLKSNDSSFKEVAKITLLNISK